MRVLVRIDVRAARDAQDSRDDECDEDEEDQAHGPQRAPALLGLLVPRERGLDVRRENGSAVSVAGCCSADSSLESGSHGF